DRYFRREQSGAPDQGDREISFDGNAFGYSLGLRYDSADSGARRLTVGVSARYLPALDVKGDQSLSLLSGDSIATIPTTRDPGWEGGLAARYFVTPDFAALASLGGRTKQAWSGFDVTSGEFTTWRVGFTFHDAQDPWTARFALGIDHEDGAPEP